MKNSEVINSSQETKESKNKKLLGVFRRHKLLFFLFLFLALGSNTYAWFIYNKIVSSEITGHVKAWNISLDGVDDVWKIELDQLYPGMETYTQSVKVNNDGEASASVSVTVNQYTLFGEKYVSSSTGDAEETVLTRTELYNNLNQYYPFIVTISTNGDVIGPSDELVITVKVEWPFEGTRQDPDKTMSVNEWDTLWGNKAYDFYEKIGSNTVPSLTLMLDINSDQIVE
ncbi:MAG: hypothetical protein ACI4WW_07910 [Candidatus Coprovivens sp.]